MHIAVLVRIVIVTNGQKFCKISITVKEISKKVHQRLYKLTGKSEQKYIKD